MLPLMDALERLGFPDSVIDVIAELFGLRDSVSLADLRAAVERSVLPGRDFIRIRRALDPTVHIRNVAV